MNGEQRKVIEQKIQNKGVTQKQVAKMVGIDKATLSRIITGSQTYTSRELIARIHHYLDHLNSDDPTIFNNYIST